MRIHFIQHVPFEPPGFLLEWAKGRGADISFTHFYLPDATLPDTLPDMLVVMGGPMGVYDALPWLADEKAYIHRAVDAGKKVLGICLGAQLIAHVLGAKVYPHTEKEIGWWPVNLTNEGEEHSLISHFPEVLTVLHWHGDTFDLPENTTLLATSAACRHQAFINNKGNAIGLQFHLEADEQMVEGFTHHDKEALSAGGKWVQTADEILSVNADTLVLNRRLLEEMLEKWSGR
jgi:GMP synthase-like glutamine amidotransferase